MDLATLFDQTYAEIRGYVGRRLGSDLADDVVDDIFELAIRKQSTYDPERGSQRAWLFGLANNKVRELRRAEHRRLRSLGSTPWEQVSDDPFSDADERVDAQRRTAELARALDTLTMGQRDVLLLHAWSGLSDVEIARALGIRPGTARSRLSRAKARLREQLHP